MEIIAEKYVVRHSRTQFATTQWPLPGTPVGWEDADMFDDRAEAEQLLKECRKAGCDGRIAVLEIRVKSRMSNR